MEFGLEGRIAFVTGASMGIGHAIAKGLADEGVHVGLFARSKEPCEALVAEIQKSHQEVKAFYSRLDFEKPETIPSAVKNAAEALGGCDILVNCASGAPRGRLDEVPDDAWDAYFAIKPLGYVRMARECLPYLKNSNQGRVINIAGHRGKEPGPYSVSGSLGNAATMSHTKWLSHHAGPFGITANIVSPGDTATYRWDNMIEREMERAGVSQEQAENTLLKDVPIGRVTRPEDVANTVIFLASKAAGVISGACINIDGGNSRSI